MKLPVPKLPDQQHPRRPGFSHSGCQEATQCYLQRLPPLTGAAILVQDLGRRHIGRAGPRGVTEHDNLAARFRVLGPLLAEVVAGICQGVGAEGDPGGCLGKRSVSMLDNN
jgi:hypothetical protein